MLTLKDRRLSIRYDVVTVEDVIDVDDYYRLQDPELGTMPGNKPRALIQGRDDEDPIIVNQACIQMLERLYDQPKIKNASNMSLLAVTSGTPRSANLIVKTTNEWLEYLKMGRLSHSQVKDLPEHIRKVFYEAKEAEWKNLMNFQSLKRINSEDRDLPLENHGETLTRYARRIGAVKLDLL